MTADAYGNAGVQVLASPHLLSLFEQAAMNAIAPGLGAGEGSVGSGFNFRHTAPTPVGMRISVTATLARVEGRRATFRLEASDAREAIAAGEHERFVIEMSRFLDRVAHKRNG
jgi:predicted thioesterase